LIWFQLIACILIILFFGRRVAQYGDIGVPSLSVLDGWWIEGHLEGITGWAIGEELEKESDSVIEATSLYNKLEFVILPLFYGRPSAYATVMRNAVAINGSFFNAQRMLDQYIRNAYY